MGQSLFLKEPVMRKHCSRGFMQQDVSWAAPRGSSGNDIGQLYARQHSESIPFHLLDLCGTFCWSVLSTVLYYIYLKRQKGTGDHV